MIVGEPPSAVLFDFEAYPEPKILSSHEIKQLMRFYPSTVRLARALGCSQAFVWERLNDYQKPIRKKSKKQNKRGNK